MPHATLESNPLLHPTNHPPFDRFRAEQVEPGMRAILAELESELSVLEREVAPTYEQSLLPYERIGERLGWSWRLVRHMLAVKNSPELRAAVERVQPDVVRFSMRLAQSRPLYEALEALRSGAAWWTLDETRRRIVDCALREARLAGVGLEGAARERFNAIQLELADLATRFSNNVLDATRAFHLDLAGADEVRGLPFSSRELFARAARDGGQAGATAEAGPWRVGLDGPSYLAFMKHAERRDLREKLHRAFLARASEGELDNTPLIRRTLELRAEKAKLLGFRSYAELSLANKMAPDVGTVERLLEDLRLPALEAARRELDEFRELALAEGAPEGRDLREWDRHFWSEKLRSERYDYDEEELRAYFPLPRVLDGLFALAERLFGARFLRADGEVAVWHPDVHFFRVLDEAGEQVAAFYLDPYSRPAEKRGGAWQGTCTGRSRAMAAPGELVRTPVAYIICNGTPPVGGRPSLMSFSEVTTLFHEFGHALQHMLTTVEEGLASGTSNVEWDAVEIASQFMENWCYHRPTLAGMTAHVETGEPIPEALFQKLWAARNHLSGAAMLRQLDFAWIDLELHERFDPASGESAFDVQRRVRRRTAVLPEVENDRFLCSFQHIFAGGYAAGYYSYKWAEVLSADAFAAFEEAGLASEERLREIGRRFASTVLALGGSRPPMEVFRAFRGREPSTEALLRHSGLASLEPAGPGTS